MSRPSIAAARALTLTEELEKLEQSITLTLQEIDHNFSRAHRIVTTSILPIVEQYGRHSEAVWEGSKFWKQFFEASANVSLSGYESPGDDTVHEETRESQSQLYHEETEETVTGATATPPRPSSPHAEDFEDTSALDSSSLAHAHSTPRAPHTKSEGASFADYSSPYETLRREMDAERTGQLEPVTPGRTQELPDMSMAAASPFKLPTASENLPTAKDPVLHHMLDKTYRIAATPHTAQKYKAPMGNTPGAGRRAPPALAQWALDSSPPSSPAPQLRAEIFSSPLKAPRTPGVSVQTPGKGTRTFDATQTKGIFDSDSDEDDDGLDFSPPKTMQFHIPQSRLLQTPAREASRRIVEDLLLTAGGDITDDTGGLEDDDSPSVVKRQMDLDDTF